MPTYYLEVWNQPKTFEAAVEALGKQLTNEQRDLLRQESEIDILRSYLHSMLGRSVRDFLSLNLPCSVLFMHMEARFKLHNPTGEEMADLIIHQCIRQLIPTRYERVLAGCREPSPS